MDNQMIEVLQDIKLDRKKEESLYRQLEHGIEQCIREGKFKAWDMIPGRKVLSKHLCVNELTVRKAIQNLVQRNVLVTRQGQGTFVAGSASLRTVLWVCGLDVFSEDISPYYTHFFRVSREECSQHGLKLKPVCLSNYRPEESEPYCTPASSREYLGYLFNGCKLSHPLLGYVCRNNLPYVHVTHEPVQSRRVSADIRQALELGLTYLIERGRKQIVIMSLPDHKSVVDEVSASFQGIEIQFIGLHDSARMTEIESEGYCYMHKLLNQRNLFSGLFIADDIVARGATRALLERSYIPEVVVLCGRQEMIPLGLPVAYVVSDTEEQARQAVRILISQIEGHSEVPDYYVAKFEIVTELTKTTHVQQSQIGNWKAGKGE